MLGSLALALLAAAAMDRFWLATGHAAWLTAAACLVRMGASALLAARGEGAWTQLLLPGLVLGHAVLSKVSPSGQSAGLVLLGFGELALIAAAARAVILSFRRQAAGDYPEIALAATLQSFLPGPVARIAAGEAVIWSSAGYGIAHGFRVTPPSGFAYFGEATFKWIPLLVLIAAPPDLILMDLLFVKGVLWKRVLLLALHAASLIWLYGLGVTMKMRPQRITGTDLLVHRGILSRARVPLDSILKVARAAPEELGSPKIVDPDRAKLSLSGPPSLEIELLKAVPVYSLFRLQPRLARKLVFSVDDATGFIAALTHVLAETAQHRH